MAELVVRFKPWPGYVRRVFHLSLRLMTFGCPSARLAYHVHKRGRKTSTFTFAVNKSTRLFEEKRRVSIALKYDRCKET